MTLYHEFAEITDESKLHQVDFEFQMTPNALIDPQINRGFVTGVKKVESRDSHGNELPCDVYDIYVQDPFVAADPANYAAVQEYIDRMETATQLKQSYTEDRTEATRRADWNAFTAAWVAGSTQSTGIWRGLVPSALALHYLTYPYPGESIVDGENNYGIVSPETAAQLRFVEDGIGVRDRGVAIAYLFSRHLSSAATDRPVNILDLAGGTAEPGLAAAKEAANQTGADIAITVLDLDEKALALAEMNAARYGFTGKLTTKRMNITSANLPQKVEKSTGVGQYDIVENAGFQEYLPQDGDELGAFKGAKLPQASEFTRRAFELVKPGGVLISGNMVLDRPQRDYLFTIVDWPLINARSDKSILRVYEKAGLLSNPHVRIEMFRVKDHTSGSHIYNIVQATKLA